MPQEHLHVLFRREEESWGKFAQRIAHAKGSVIVILTPVDAAQLLAEGERPGLLQTCAEFRSKVRVAVRHPPFEELARHAGVRLITSTRDLRRALHSHPQRDDALRMFAPGLWRQMWRSRLQSAGLLTLPKLRIVMLVGLSSALFLYVVFRLLPSATITVRPRGEMATQTMNVLLVQSGVTLPTHIHILPLFPVEVLLTKTITSEQISKEFTGTNAEVAMTIINASAADVSLKKGTRLRNQAGMLFRTRKSVVVPASGTVQVIARSDELDAFGEIVGERGNVPAGLRWDLPALTPEDQKNLYGTNRVPATGGKTSYRTVLKTSDIELAKQRLQRELKADARKQVNERLQALMFVTGKNQLRLLNNDQLVSASFTGVILPLDRLGQSVPSIDVTGSITYRMFAYDANAILSLIHAELLDRVPPDRRIDPASVDISRLELRIFDYADDLSWIKGTAELAAIEKPVLDPLSPSGARFAKLVREKVAGLPRQQAIGLVQNLPEVEKVSIDMWPPWSRILPVLPTSISIVENP